MASGCLSAWSLHAAGRNVNRFLRLRSPVFFLHVKFIRIRTMDDSGYNVNGNVVQQKYSGLVANPSSVNVAPWLFRNMNFSSKPQIFGHLVINFNLIVFLRKAGYLRCKLHCSKCRDKERLYIMTYEVLPVLKKWILVFLRWRRVNLYVDTKFSKERKAVVWMKAVCSS